MKNKFIEKKLNIYAEAVKPDGRLIVAALNELRIRKAQGMALPSYFLPKNRQGQIIAALVAAVLLLSLVIFVFFRNSDTNMKYSLSQLTYQAVPVEEIPQSILTIDLDDFYINARVYYEGDIPVTVSVLYKTTGEGGLDEAIVIADLGGGLMDYTGFKKYLKSTINGVTVCKRQIRENGEYYTEAYFRYCDIDYYLMVTSPIKDSADDYIMLLFEK